MLFRFSIAICQLFVLLTVILEASADERGAKRHNRSLRGKRFCGFSEQRKTEERDFDNFAAQEIGTSEKIERGGRREGIMEQKME